MHQETFFFLKPDAVLRRYVGARVLKEILKLECEVKFFALLKAPRKFLATRHYVIHEGTPFYNWLLDFTSWSDIAVLMINGLDIVSRVREILGPTMVEQAAVEKPTSLRARYGIFKGINLAHASDSLGTASEEISTWSNWFNMRSDPQAREKVEKYISDCLHYPYVDVALYRDLANEFKGSQRERDKIKEAFISLLRRESDRKNHIRLDSFAEIMVRALVLSP